MSAEDDLIRFHNGDTLGNIPVVRPRDRSSSPPLRTLLITVAVAALVSGSAVGWALSQGGQETSAAPPPVKAAQATRSVPPSFSPAPAPTITVWQAPSDPTPEAEPEPVETIYVGDAPATGGDPSTDYCIFYTDHGSAVLLANAPDYLCDDVIFSTHPSTGSGVWEEEAPDCSATPGARPVFFVFGESTSWYGADAYTCLATKPS